MQDIDKEHKAYFENLPGIADLPEPVRVLVESLPDLAPREQLALVHEFTLGYMKYELPQGKDDRIKHFSELLEHPIGDCDDYAMFSAALLDYAGIDPGAVFFVTGSMNYGFAGPNGEARELWGPHAYLAVQDSENKSGYVILDNNAADIFTVDESDLSAGIKLKIIGREESIPATANIGEVYTSHSSDGQARKYGPPPQEYLQLLEEVASPLNQPADPMPN